MRCGQSGQLTYQFHAANSRIPNRDEGKRLDDPLSPLYIAGTRGVVARLLAQHPVTPAVQASIPMFNQRGGDP